MRFLLDENLPPEIRDLLLEAGHDVIYVPHSNYRGWSDRQLWTLAGFEQRIVVTLDSGFRQPIQPKPAGMVLMRLRDRATRADYRRVFAEFMKSKAFDQLEGKAMVVRPGHVRMRPL